MSINFSKLTVSTNKCPLEPRDIFMALPLKDKNYGYPRDVQTEVWKQWFEKRNEKNIIVKMNTGSGKTVVGLIILQSCLNEGKGPAVYIVPDNFLVQQVCHEAEKIGIKVVKDTSENKGEDDYFFKENKAILVTNIYKLVNGKSVFGLRSDNNIKIGSIVIDDVHACLDIIEQQHTILIKPELELYGDIIKSFSKYQEVRDNQNFHDITEINDPRLSYLVPFWVWQKENSNIYNKINNSKFSKESFVLFNLPLMKDNWKTVNCVVSARGIEMTLKGIPINKITNFEQAQRRIFMSATLADDSVFVSAIGLKANDIFNSITPEKADDIGERLIVFPQYLNPTITDIEIKQTISNVAKEYNVVVIVPSFDRASFWSDVNPSQILSSKENNIESGIASLKKNNLVGLTILVNKYDGIDLPDAACRILVIDGLPTMRSEYDIVIQGMNPNDRRLCREQIQKIEQGMGRGVRSNNDYCSVVLMGVKLSNAIFNQHGADFFSSATLTQLNFSKQIWEELMRNNEKPTIDNIFLLNKYVLNRDPSWISASKSVLSDIVYNKSGNLDSLVLAMRNAFEQECLDNYKEAADIIQREINNIEDSKAKGLLMQYMAEYTNFYDPGKAQELLLSARKINSSVLKPINGIQFSKLDYSANSQGINVINYMTENNLSGNNYIIYVKNILSDLTFSGDSADKFEYAFKEIFTIIGISSSRPENEFGGKAPDNLLALGKSEYAIIECKNRTTTDVISKRDCGQLLQSVQWFKNKYKEDQIKYYPIMIHNSSTFGSDASPSEDMRIMTPQLLHDLSKSIENFSQLVVQPNVIGNVQEIGKGLTGLKLDSNQIIKTYTQSFSQKNK